MSDDGAAAAHPAAGRPPRAIFASAPGPTSPALTPALDAPARHGGGGNNNDDDDRFSRDVRELLDPRLITGIASPTTRHNADADADADAGSRPRDGGAAFTQTRTSPIPARGAAAAPSEAAPSEAAPWPRTASQTSLRDGGHGSTRPRALSRPPHHAAAAHPEHAELIQLLLESHRELHAHGHAAKAAGEASLPPSASTSPRAPSRDATWRPPMLRRRMSVSMVAANAETVAAATTSGDEALRPEHFDQPETLAYLDLLMGMPIHEIRQERGRLEAAYRDVSAELQSVISKDYRTFLTVADALGGMRDALATLNDQATQLAARRTSLSLTDVPGSHAEVSEGTAASLLDGLRDQLQRFAAQSDALLRQRRELDGLQQAAPQIGDLLEVPELIQLLSKHGYYDEALQLYLHIATIAQQPPACALLTDHMLRLEASSQTCLDVLDAAASSLTRGDSGDPGDPDRDPSTPPSRRVEPARPEAESSFLMGIFAQSQVALDAMAAMWLRLLAEPLKISVAFRVVGFLRRLRVLSEWELGRLFLAQRRSFLDQQLLAIDRGAALDPTVRLRKCLDTCREHAFDILTQFHTLFLDKPAGGAGTAGVGTSARGDDAAVSLAASAASPAEPAHHGLPILSSEFAIALTRRCLSLLETHLSQIHDVADIANVHSSATYLAVSLGRMGADFRPILTELTENAVYERLATKLTADICDAWIKPLKEHGWIAFLCPHLTAMASSSTTAGAGLGPVHRITDVKNRPTVIRGDTAFMSCVPMARVYNLFVDALNQLRFFPSIELGPRIAAHYLAVLTDVVDALNTSLAAEKGDESGIPATAAASTTASAVAASTPAGRARSGSTAPRPHALTTPRDPARDRLTLAHLLDRLVRQIWAHLEFGIYNGAPAVSAWMQMQTLPLAAAADPDALPFNMAALAAAAPSAAIPGESSMVAPGVPPPTTVPSALAATSPAPAATSPVPASVESVLSALESASPAPPASSDMMSDPFSADPAAITIMATTATAVTAPPSSASKPTANAPQVGQLAPKSASPSAAPSELPSAAPLASPSASPSVLPSVVPAEAVVPADATAPTK
ncbi:hypothetical protein CXG81DRAFT_18303 [Caulochytrium protostelioides]|uniref:Conserved oligomeric Golgi complex subunit 8 n=1 Tax=Caulochytrium protostelioides TaxID=1555241 RepID=A0A4P9WVA4_9FUNG|nr:hypothetical protein CAUPRSCDRAFT_10997 [Caulochytrium protostelioides]RKP01943.1 hypothetical protein CXG81DRAFT_18303 [Caulochytrium protostelioides]|eukprot:RKP01943.1 hypothetical protein CXG81DRAFT_18303 [Caulochytrium protostelioides]